MSNVLTGTKLGRHPDGTDNLIAWEVGEVMDTGVAPGRRVIAPHTSHDGGFNSTGENLLLSAILWTWALDTDGDAIYDHLDSDSDNDSCNDANETYASSTADGDNNGYYGTGNPPAVNADGTVSAATYSTPVDANSNFTFDFQEVGTASSISSQPSNLKLCPGCNGSFTVATTNGDTFQWQILNGISWDDLTNSGIYGGADTATLTVTNVTPSDNGNEYRVIVSNSTFTCTSVTSNTAILTVNATTIITNRRITHRVKKN